MVELTKLFSRDNGETGRKYKPKVEKTSFVDIFNAIIFAGTLTGAFIMLGIVYSIYPNSIIFYLSLVSSVIVIICIFAPLQFVTQKLFGSYQSKPRVVNIRGSREQLNAIAPKSLEIFPDHVKLNDSYARTFYVEKYPPELWDGWLSPVLASRERISTVLHVYPGDAEYVKAQLDMEIGKIDSNLMRMSETDPKTVPLKYLSAELKDYRDALITGRTNPFNASLYFNLKAKTKKELDENTKELTRWFKGRNITIATPHLKAERALRAVMPSGVDNLGKYHAFDTQSLKTIMPFARNAFGMEEGILYGRTSDEQPVIFSIFKMRVPHQAVLGATRSGKSYYLKYSLWRLYLYYPEMRVFIVDPTPLPTGVSEFTPLTKKVGGQLIALGAQEQGCPTINPFDIRMVSLKSKTPLTDKLLKVSSFLTIILELTPHELAVVESVLPNVYAKKGITDVLNIPTFEGDSPIFSDLQTELREFAKSPEASAQDRTICDKIARMLQPWVNSMFNRQTNISLKARWITFDISTIRNTPMFAPAAFLIMEYIYGQVIQTAQPKAVLFDECHLSLGQESVRKELAIYVSEFGKYGAGLIVASQSAEDFLRYPEGRKILDNCPVTILMKHEAISEEMQKRWKFTHPEQDVIRRAKTGAEGLGYSEGLFIAENSRAKILFVADPHEHPVITTKPEELLGEGERSG